MKMMSALMEVQMTQTPLKMERAKRAQVNLKIIEKKKVAAPSNAKTVANFAMKKDK
jgi:hypothetical protein